MTNREQLGIAGGIGALLFGVLGVIAGHQANRTDD